MAYSVFLDVNIIIDFFLPERKEHDVTVKLMDAVDQGLVKTFFSESVVNTTAYLIRKSIYVDEFKAGMIELCSFINILPCSTKIIQNAYRIAKNDLEDAVLYQLALEHNMDYFVTSNIKDFKKIANKQLPVITAKEMVHIIEH